MTNEDLKSIYLPQPTIDERPWGSEGPGQPCRPADEVRSIPTRISYIEDVPTNEHQIEPEDQKQPPSENS